MPTASADFAGIRREHFHSVSVLVFQLLLSVVDQRRQFEAHAVAFEGSISSVISEQVTEQPQGPPVCSDPLPAGPCGQA